MTNREDNNDVPVGANLPLDTATQLEALTAHMKRNEKKLAQLEAENASLKAENTPLIIGDRSSDIDVSKRTLIHVIVGRNPPGTSVATTVFQRKTSTPDTSAARTTIA